jgi:hypothetical protein
MDRLKKTLPELALESVMIVLSVLPALAASSWADAHKEHKLAVQARESFVQEVQANRARVMKALPSAGSVGHVQSDMRRCRTRCRQLQNINPIRANRAARFS